MVKDPINYLEELAKHNITRAIIHIESRFDITELRNKARELDILLGYAINPETNLALLKPYFETNAYFQVMGVTPGNSNQAQIDQTPLAVAFLRKSTLQHIIISVDGGVSEQNVDRLRRSGADYLVSTHAIFTTGDWQENYNKLTSLSEDSNK